MYVGVCIRAHACVRVCVFVKESARQYSTEGAPAQLFFLIMVTIHVRTLYSLNCKFYDYRYFSIHQLTVSSRQCVTESRRSLNTVLDFYIW